MAIRSSAPFRALPGFWSLRRHERALARAVGSGSRCRVDASNGDPGFDVWAMDVARYGAWATRTYTNEKVREKLLPPVLDSVPP